MNLHHGFLFSLALLASCFSYAGELVLKFEHEVTVSMPSQEGKTEAKTYPANQEIVLTSDQVYWLESKGKVPTLIVPSSFSKRDPMKVALVDVANWPSPTMQKVIDNKFSSLMDLMTQFQAQLSKKNVDAAEQIINRMAVVEDMPSLDIFRAYLAYMRGDIEKAKTSVRRALAQHPDNVQGQELLKTLEGKKP